MRSKLLMLLAPFLRRWSYTRVAEQVMDHLFFQVVQVSLGTLTHAYEFECSSCYLSMLSALELRDAWDPLDQACSIIKRPSAY